FYHAFTITEDNHLAWDAVNDQRAKAKTKVHEGKVTDGTFLTFTRLKAIEFVRKRERRSRKLHITEADVASPKEQEDETPWSVEDGTDPTDTFHEAEAHALRERVKATLAPDELILIECAEKELPYDEIAKVIGTTVDGVKGRLKRLRERLRNQFGDEFDGLF